LLFGKVGTINRQGNDELRTLVYIAIYTDFTSVQLYQVFSQRKTNTRPYSIELAVIPFIESLKESFLLFFRDATTVVLYTQANKVFVLGIGKRHLYIAAFFIVFRRIGQEIIQYLVKFIRIKVSHNGLRITEYGKMNFSFLDKRLERFSFILHKGDYITRRDPQSQITSLRLSKFKYLL